MSSPGPGTHDHNTQTRRAVLAGGALGAGVLGAQLLSPSSSEAQTALDDHYVFRSRMPLNVKDYGATGDGSTDDTGAIQNTISAAEVDSGGTVYFPPGEYVVNGGLEIPLTSPIRLAGAGMTPGFPGNNRPTRLVRTSGSTPLVTAGDDTSNAFQASHALEICDMEIRAKTAGRTADFAACNPLNLHNLKFVGGDGIRLRQVFNSNGSGLYFTALGTASSPAVLFDALPLNQGGCATVHWTNVEWEGNSGVDVKFDGITANSAPTNDVKITNWKAEGGSGGPHVVLAYCQGVTLDNGSVSFHGRGTNPALVVNHPFDHQMSIKLPSLEIGYSGTDAPQDAIQVTKGTLDLGIVTVIGTASGPTRSVVRVESGAAADAVRWGGSLRRNSAVPNAISDARTRAEYVSGVETKPKVRAYNSSSISVANNTSVALALDSEWFDAGTETEQHTTSGSNSRLTCRVAGLYAIHGAVEFAAAGGGTQRAAAIRLNGGTGTVVGGWVKCPPLGAATTVALAPSTLHQLAVGDYVELLVYQDSGGPLTVNAASERSPVLAMAYLSP